MTPHAFAADFIRHWEDGGSTDPARTHSLDPVDAGNWSGGKRGLGQLIGSNHGVTPLALALHRHVPPASITRGAMHALTIDEACDIAIAHYYVATGLSRLAWNRVTMSAFDMAWGAGPAHAIAQAQRLIGVADDGCIGIGTIGAWAGWIGGVGEDAAARAYAAARIAYYEGVIRRIPGDAKYRNGWIARTRYYLPGDPAGWWSKAA